MPCCAFAAFILGQVMIGLHTFKRFVFGARADHVGDNPATEWRLDRTSPLAASPRRLSLRWIAAAGLIELVLVAGGAYGLRSHLGHLAHHHHAVVARGR